MRNAILWAALGVGLVASVASSACAEEKGGGDENSKAAKLFDDLDKNHDGKLTRDELAKMHDVFDKKKAGHLSSKEFEDALAAVSKEEGKIDLFKGAIDLSIYTIVVFVILFVILRAFAWGPIAAGLDARESGIARDKHEADAARKEAGDMREKLTADMAKANAEVRTMLDKARADAQQTAAAELARGKADLAAERERLYREVGIAKDAASKEVFDQGAKLAALISAKTIKKQLTEDDHRSLLDEALREFRAAAQTRKSDLESATA